MPFPLCLRILLSSQPHRSVSVCWGGLDTIGIQDTAPTAGGRRGGATHAAPGAGAAGGAAVRGALRLQVAAVPPPGPPRRGLRWGMGVQGRRTTSVKGTTHLKDEIGDGIGPATKAASKLTPPHGTPHPSAPGMMNTTAPSLRLLHGRGGPPTGERGPRPRLTFCAGYVSASSFPLHMGAHALCFGGGGEGVSWFDDFFLQGSPSPTRENHFRLRSEPPTPLPPRGPTPPSPPGRARESLKTLSAVVQPHNAGTALRVGFWIRDAQGPPNPPKGKWTQPRGVYYPGASTHRAVRLTAVISHSVCCKKNPATNVLI